MKVLVVDDDASMRRAMARLLKAAGYESFAFESAEALLLSEASEAAGCVVSDLHLPAMSGLQLLDELRGRGLGHVPVILITAFDAPGLREQALRYGAAAYLTKPFQGAALLEAIRDEADLSRPD